MALKYDQQSINAARMILEHPIVNEIFDDMERDMMNAAINTKSIDTDLTAACLAEIRAIRKFKSTLNFLVTNGEATLKRNTARK